MEFSSETIRRFRLHSHHLDQKLPFERLTEAAGACGLQNSPPGAWETAMFHRLEGCTLEGLKDALYAQKTLLQAWSFRGVPAVFPTAQRDVFLTALKALPDEQPWIYTRGITAALDFLGMDFFELLPLVEHAASSLDGRFVRTKELLDQTLADLILPELPPEKRPLWNAPSMYGRPERQTVGGAAVSFLLRPCSFSSLVVFGERQGSSPVFTSAKTWLEGTPFSQSPSFEPAQQELARTQQMLAKTQQELVRTQQMLAKTQQELVRKFLRCYGPSTRSSFESWLGCSPAQGRRLWNGLASEMTEVTVNGKKSWLLTEDLPSLLEIRQSFADGSAPAPERLLLLGPHDPWLDLRDREIILPEKALHRLVWKTVAKPGAAAKGGRIVGVWNSRTRKDGLEISLNLWNDLPREQLQTLKEQAKEYASFRLLPLLRYTVNSSFS